MPRAGWQNDDVASFELDFGSFDAAAFHRGPTLCESLARALQEAAIFAVALAKDHLTHDTDLVVCVEALDDEGEMLGKSTCVVMVEQFGAKKRAEEQSLTMLPDRK